jgi:hypothetical protein
MKQETAFSMFCGALAAVGAYGLYKAGKWTTVAVGDLSRGLGAIGVMAEQNHKLAENSMLVATEINLLRSVIQSANPSQGATASGENPQPEDGTVPAPKPKPAPFPSVPPEMYRVVPPPPDAEVDDTVIDDTPDERMVLYEKLEELRQTGIEADPEELQDGILGQV